jgi:hypothetical protein
LGGKYPLGSVLDGRMYLENCPFLLDFPIYLNIGFQSFLVVVTSSFSFLILLIWVFSLLLLVRFEGICQSYFSKLPAFCFIDYVCVCVCVCVYICLYFVNFSHYFYYFSSTCFGFSLFLFF